MELEHIYDSFKKKNINEILILDDNSKKELSQLINKNQDEIKNMYFDLNNIFTGGFQKASKILETENQQQQQLIYLKTGNDYIDNYLYGGIRKGEIVEITGQPSSGKTNFLYQICNSFANSVQNIQNTKNNQEQKQQEEIQEKNNIDQNLEDSFFIYIFDSGKNFFMDQFQNQYGTKNANYLKEISKIIKINGIDEFFVNLCFYFQDILNKIQQNPDFISIILIDSITQILTENMQFEDYRKKSNEISQKFYEIAQKSQTRLIFTSNQQENYSFFTQKENQYFNKKIKSLVKSPLNFSINYTIQIERVLILSDALKKRAEQTFTILDHSKMDNLNIDGSSNNQVKIFKEY